MQIFQKKSVLSTVQIAKFYAGVRKAAWEVYYDF